MYSIYESSYNDAKELRQEGYTCDVFYDGANVILNVYFG